LTKESSIWSENAIHNKEKSAYIAAIFKAVLWVVEEVISQASGHDHAEYSQKKKFLTFLNWLKRKVFLQAHLPSNCHTLQIIAKHQN
jgi:hypothetical protein